MDNLVLIRVAASLDKSLAQATLRQIRAETPHRRRLLFERDGRTLSIVVSLDPVRPWIGRPAGRWEGPRRAPDRFSSAITRALEGRPVLGVCKPTADRALELRFSGDRTLAVELATHRANLILLDSEGKVDDAARHPPSGRERLAKGATYRQAATPSSRLDPLDAGPEAIDRFLEGLESRGETPFEALRRHLFGVGSEAARLIVEERLRTGDSHGLLLRRRIDSLLAGESDPVVLAPADPALSPAARGSMRLLPWDLPHAWHDWPRFRREDVAATAGLFHDLLEREGFLDRRRADLTLFVRREIARLTETEARVRTDLEGFDDPERHRLWGEALLAGLVRARRLEGGFAVPDPYSQAGTETVVPAKPGADPRRVVDEHFRAHRRALRGLERGRTRLEQVRTKRQRLEVLRDKAENEAGLGLEQLEREMREEGIPVGLEPGTRAAAAARRVSRPRVEGVRVFAGPGGETILVGKGGRENHRLTFKLAGPEDFWLHARGVPGAHVILRNDRRNASPPADALAKAAALAAWYSGARSQPIAEVQWTRRKYVRHPRGTPAGSVRLKRHETLRVRPSDAGISDSAVKRDKPDPP